MMKQTIEKEIYAYITNVVTLLANNKDFVFDVSYNDNNDDSDFFSEIEIEMWKDSNLQYAYSIIIFIDGRQQGTKEELLKEFLYDFFENVKE